MMVMNSFSKERTEILNTYVFFLRKMKNMMGKAKAILSYKNNFGLIVMINKIHDFTADIQPPGVIRKNVYKSRDAFFHIC